MTLFSDVVKIVDDVTNGLEMQTKVVHSMYLGDGGVGDPKWKKVTRRAVVARRTRTVMSFSGQVVTSNTTVTFVAGNVPVVEHDKIKISDGTEDEVIGAGSPMDASGRLITEAYLG